MQARRRSAAVLNKSFRGSARLLGASAISGILACNAAAPPCEDLTAKADWVNAERVCRASFQKRGLAVDGVELALSLLYQDRYDEVVALFPTVERLLQDGATQIRMHWVVGAALARRGQSPEARLHLRRALEPSGDQASQARSPSLRARAALELAGVEWREGQLRAAREYQQLAATLAAEAGDRAMATYARLGLIDILRLEGDLTGTERELAELALVAETQSDRAMFLLKLGIAYNDLGSEALARESLTTAFSLENSSQAPRDSVLVPILLNLSWVERRSGSYAKALEHIAAAAALGAEPMDVYLNRGLALRDAGQTLEAAALLAAAQAAGPTGDWIWWLYFNRGEVDLQLGEFASAERHLRSAIAAIEQQRAGSSSVIPAVSVRQREVYTALIGVLAGQRRWPEVLEVVQRLDEGSMAQLLISPVASLPSSLFRGKQSQSAPGSPLTMGSSAALIDAWRSRWLVILVPGGPRMWRLELRGGRLRGGDAGELKLLEAGAAALEREPIREQDALRVGEALMPFQPDVKLSPALQPIDVFLVGQIGRAPLAALRDRVGLLRDRFSIGRVLRIAPRASLSPSPGPAVVLGDPRLDLEQASMEAKSVARMLGTRPRLGAEATSQVLREAGAAAVLHIAAHTVMVEGRPALQLADRAVLPAEIRSLTPAPRLVVIGTCGSASERDQETWGSLAGAFLDAGSEAVIATTRSVPDADARRLIEEVYQHDVLADPSRALALAQRALERDVPAASQAAFVVLRAPPSVPPPGAP